LWNLTIRNLHEVHEGGPPSLHPGEGESVLKNFHWETVWGGKELSAHCQKRGKKGNVGLRFHPEGTFPQAERKYFRGRKKGNWVKGPVKRFSRGGGEKIVASLKSSSRRGRRREQWGSREKGRNQVLHGKMVGKKGERYPRIWEADIFLVLKNQA